MIFLFKQPGLAFIRRNQKYIVVGSIPSLPQRRMVSPAAVVAATMSASDSILPARLSAAQQGKAPRHHARKPLGLLPGRFYQKTILLMNGVWWAYGMKAREGSGSVIIREARFPGVIEPRVSSTPMA